MAETDVRLPFTERCCASSVPLSRPGLAAPANPRVSWAASTARRLKAHAATRLPRVPMAGSLPPKIAGASVNR